MQFELRNKGFRTLLQRCRLEGKTRKSIHKHPIYLRKDGNLHELNYMKIRTG